MDIEKIVRDLTSRDTQRIRKAGLLVIQGSQSEKAIESLLPYLRQIKKSTAGLRLGGAFASNDRFYKFPIEILEFYKDRASFWNRNRKCTCTLYLSKSYEGYNPEKESDHESIELVTKLKGNWTHDYEMKCLKCNESYYVSERHYHMIWWHWEVLRFNGSIKKSGKPQIDNEFLLLTKVVRKAIRLNNINAEALLYEKQRLIDYRMKLAYNKGTEMFESIFGWSEVFDDLIKEIDDRIVHKASSSK